MLGAIAVVASILPTFGGAAAPTRSWNELFAQVDRPTLERPTPWGLLSQSFLKSPATSLMPNDPELGRQWGYFDIMADQAWERIRHRTGSEVVVAVVDTGIRLDHPDLRENLWINLREQNGVPGDDDDGNGFVDDVHGYDFISDSAHPDDDNGHGTHSAGTIGAVIHNSFGISGIGTRVRLMAVKVLDRNMSVSSAETIAMGIDYAVQNGADIINASFGGPEDPMLLAAVERAERAGVLVVAAVGNYRQNIDLLPFYPAAYRTSNLVSVAAINRSNALWTSLGGGSNFWPLTVDLAAPGEAIYSTHIDERGFKLLSGTSQAAPMVSGVAALIKSAHPTWRAAEIKEHLELTSERRPFLQGLVRTAGVVNAFRAVTDQRRRVDPDDPAFWKRFRDYRVSSPHPMKPGQVWETVIENEENSRVSFFVARLKLSGESSLLVLDEQGGTLATYTASMLRTWSAPFSGRRIRLVLRAGPGFENSYGLDLLRLAFSPQ